MNKSDSIVNLAKSLSQAQAEFKRVGFDETNPFLKNKYASLGAFIDASRPILAKYKLSMIQPTTTTEYGVGVTTVLIHDSGEFIESTISIPIGEEKGKSMAQVAGSVISYMRRYSLAAMLNMYSDGEDNDGNTAKKAVQVEPKEQASRPFEPERLKAILNTKSAAYALNNKTADANGRTKLAASLHQLTQGDEEIRHALTKYIFGVESQKDLTDGMVLAFNEWLKSTPDRNGKFVLDALAVKDYLRLHDEVFSVGAGE